MVPIALPMSLTAGAVNGIAVVLARADDAIFYLVDNAALEGPPVWVHEAEVEKCRVVGIAT
jgi:hypothetical protein